LSEQDANALAYCGNVFDRIRGGKALFDLAFRGSKDRHTLEKKNDTNLLEMVMNHDSFVLFPSTNISSSFFQPKPANFISLRVIYTVEVCRENARTC
jgi:hypothetical protein